jgi:hypothetical protein
VERPAEREISAALRHEGAEPVAQPVRQSLGVSVLVRAQQRLQARVGVLDDQPAAGPQCADHRGERGRSGGHVDEDQAGEDEVERALWRRVGADVVPAHLDTGEVGGSQDVSMSVASTRSAGPTRAASPAGTVTPPAPTSQHRQPVVTPVWSRCRNVTGSSSRASASNRCPASACRSSSR